MVGLATVAVMYDLTAFSQGKVKLHSDATMWMEMFSLFKQKIQSLVYTLTSTANLGKNYEHLVAGISLSLYSTVIVVGSKKWKKEIVVEWSII